MERTVTKKETCIMKSTISATEQKTAISRIDRTGTKTYVSSRRDCSIVKEDRMEGPIELKPAAMRSGIERSIEVPMMAFVLRMQVNYRGNIRKSTGLQYKGVVNTEDEDQKRWQLPKRSLSQAAGGFRVSSPRHQIDLPSDSIAETESCQSTTGHLDEASNQETRARMDSIHPSYRPVSIDKDCNVSDPKGRIV